MSDLSWVPTVPSFMAYWHVFFSEIFHSTWLCSLQLQHILFFHIIHRFFIPVVKLQKLRLWAFWSSKSVYSFGSYGLAKSGCHNWKKKKVAFFRPIVFKKPSLTLYHKLYHSGPAQSLPRSSLGTNALNSETFLP